MAKKKNLTKAEQKKARLRQRRMEREAKERERMAELYEDCDGRFAFIVGYTDGGAPYGVMWEEVGIDPGLPFEEKSEALSHADVKTDSSRKKRS